MEENTKNKQTDDGSEAATERERGSTEANRPNVAQEYLDNWKRERADFLNYKKDELKRLSEFAKFANEGVVLEVIELLDDLETASKETGDPGLNQIVKKFEEFLKKYNVERIDTGGKFDPLLHEAVAAPSDVSSEALAEEEASSEGREGVDGGKLEEVRAGYTMYGKVIRPARVKIIK